MEKSDYYYRRKEYMDKLEAPTISEVKEELGKALAEAFFSQCPEELKPDLGLTPPLKGTGDNLWMSPSDLLIGKVCLKPPLTSKHVRALTHQGILDIGRDVEVKFWNEMELEKQRALAEQEAQAQYHFEKEKLVAAEEARREERKLCEAEKLLLHSDFEEKLQDELQKLQEYLTAQHILMLEEQKQEMELVWQQRLEEAVQETVTNLTIQFLEDLKKQEEELIRKFKSKLKKEYSKFVQSIKAERGHCKEILKQLKHQLECKNIANMMYILCMERHKCQEERKTIEHEYQKQILELQDNIIEKSIEIKKLIEERNFKDRQVNIREECLLEILRQFQKFINFALRAVPTQAEFLLNIEKMMLFELTQAVANVVPNEADVQSWKSDSQLDTIGTSSNNSLDAKDYHQCANELDPSQSEHSLKSGDALPVLYYNKYMYVREEFRNMFSQGIEITPSNMLWNKDVQHLMLILKKSVSRHETGERIGDNEKTPSGSLKSDRYETGTSRSQQSGRSSVHFDGADTGFQYTVNTLPIPSEMFGADPLDFEFPCIKPAENSMHTHKYARKKSVTVSSSQLNQRSSLKVNSKLDMPLVDYNALKEEGSKFLLLSARNSIELHRESLMMGKILYDEKIKTPQCSSPVSLLDGDTNRHSRNALLAADDSLTKHKKFVKQDQITFNSSYISILAPDVIDLGKEKQASPETLSAGSNPSHKKNSPKRQLTESKLCLARDSVVLHKESILLKETDLKLPFEQELKVNLHPSEIHYSNISPTASVRNVEFPVKSRMSKISMARDSVDMLRGSNKSLVNTTTKFAAMRTSKISMHQDSLELIRRQSKISHDSIRRPSQSVEILDGICAAKPTHPPIPARCTEGEDMLKSMKLARSESVKILEQRRRKSSSVTFSPHAFMCNTDKTLSPELPWDIYGKSTKEKLKENNRKQEQRSVKKPNVAKIVGDVKATEHLQKHTDFTVHRVNSMLRIFRAHPSLIKIFTPCGK